MYLNTAFPNFKVLGEELITTTGSSVSLGTSATTGCDGICIIPTGGNCHVAFRSATASTSNLKVVDGDQIFLEINQQEAAKLRLWLTAGQVRIIGFNQQ